MKQCRALKSYRVKRATAALLASIALLGLDRDEVPLYRAGGVARARCDWGDELKRLSIYSTPQAVWEVSDPNVDMPIATRFVRAGSLLRIVSTMRHQTYTSFSHAPYLNLQILEVEPADGGKPHGFVSSLDVDPADKPKPSDNICM